MPARQLPWFDRAGTDADGPGTDQAGCSAGTTAATEPHRRQRWPARPSARWCDSFLAATALGGACAWPG